MQLEDLNGRVAVITGASSGIGEAAARQLVAEGVQVVLAARSADKITALAEELGASAMAVTTDVGVEDDVERLFEAVRARHGGVDLLFNNAGVGYHGAFVDNKRDEWRATIDANLYGVLYCTQAAIPLMQGRRGAMVSTVASVVGRRGLEGWAVYSATKHAVVGLHDALRQELGPQGIRVSLLEPGAVYTQWGYNVAPAQMQDRRDTLQALHADDIARALVFAFAQPENVNIQEAWIMPTRQTHP